jgi:tetratricopeptide (TPR) repeat protein/DNA-binding XRE family transcriptional regulator
MDLDLDPRLSRLVVRSARLVHGGTQQELADDSGVAASTIAAAESGQHAVTARIAGKLFVAAGIEPADVELLLYTLKKLCAGDGTPRYNPLPAGLRRRESAWEEAVAGLARAFDRQVGHPRTIPAGEPAGAAGSRREDAAALWLRLAPYPAPQRRALVLGATCFRSRELAVLLCDQSLLAAADSSARAVELADLALLIARLVPEEAGLSAALQAWAHAHLGNALRVQGDHAAAERELDRACELHASSAAFDRLFDPARLLGFEASLRRDQRRFDEALILLEDALLYEGSTLRPQLLINKARLLRELGEAEAALEVFQRAEPYLAAGIEPRLAFIARANLAYCLSLLERHEEAEHWLAEARRLAVPSAGALDRLRLDGVGARVAAGTGRVAEGIATLERVRRELAALDLDYDAALAALELAALLLEQGETARVQALVREMLPAFQSRAIHREALAALRLFRQAVEQERATAELAREVTRYLHRARHQPELRFPATSSADAPS